MQGKNRAMTDSPSSPDPNQPETVSEPRPPRLSAEEGSPRPSSRLAIRLVLLITVIIGPFLAAVLWPTINAAAEWVVNEHGRYEWAAIVALGLVVTVALISVAYRLEWTGLPGREVKVTTTTGDDPSTSTEHEKKKTLWDWLDLLIVPTVLAIGGLWFAAQQETRQFTIENQREDIERSIADERAQYTALQEYLHNMATLILSDKEGGLENAPKEGRLRELARARTLTVLFALGGERKRAVVTFLYEADLISKPNPIVDLSGADLQDTHLQSVDYHGIDLHGAILTDGRDDDPDREVGALMHNSNFSDANLSGADLRGTILSGTLLNDGPDTGPQGDAGANLSGAILAGADLTLADLSKADLSNANLTEATLLEARLNRANLEGAIMPDGTTHP